MSKYIYLHRKEGRPVWRFKFIEKYKIDRGRRSPIFLRDVWIYKSRYGNIYCLHTEHITFGQFYVMRFDKNQACWFGVNDLVYPFAVEFPDGAVYFWKWPEIRDAKRYEQSRSKLP